MGISPENDNSQDDVHRHGGGKNSAHGRSAPPSLEAQRDQYKQALAELKVNQGSKQDKAELEKKIINTQRKIDQMPKGENHSQKAKGSNGGRKR
jgi:hypothetical protein